MKKTAKILFPVILGIGFVLTMSMVNNTNTMDAGERLQTIETTEQIIQYKSYTSSILIEEEYSSRSFETTITTPAITPTPIPTPTPVPLWEQCGLSEEDFELFARVVAAEDAGPNVDGFKDYDNQVAIAQVVWNRVDSSNWPNTVREVLCERNPTQFSTVHNGECNKVTDDYCRAAIVDAYINRPHPSNIIYFRSGHFFSGLEQYMKIGDNYFSYE